MYRYLILALCVSVLMGCNQGREYQGGHYEPPPVQEIDQFALVDSYGVDSGVSRNTPLTLDPYLYEGLFEVYWDMSLAGHYEFYLSVSPTADIYDGVTVYSEYCGPGEVCHTTGYAVCQYTADFTLGCAEQPALDVYALFYEVPQTLHWFAEACGADGCSFRRLPVTML